MSQPQIYVNVRVNQFQHEDFGFLSVQNLQPEIYFSGEDIDTASDERFEAIRQEIATGSFKPIFHAPFYDLNFGAHDSKLRLLSEERVLWALQTAKRYGASQMVVHPGYGPWVLAKHFHSWLERAKPGLGRIVTQAKEAGIRLAFENIFDDKPEDLLELITSFATDKVGFCFDLGHFNLFSHAPMKQWLDVLGPHIFEVHLHDNLGDRDDHIAIGDGTVKYGPLIAWLRNSATHPLLTLEMEQKTHIIKSVNRVREWFEAPKDQD